MSSGARRFLARICSKPMTAPGRVHGNVIVTPVASYAGVQTSHRVRTGAWPVRQGY
jgi:hypothetical protein